MVAPMDNLGCSCGLLYRYVVDKEKQMNDVKQENLELAYEILDDADVVEVFDDSVWLKVDKELFEQWTLR